MPKVGCKRGFKVCQKSMAKGNRCHGQPLRRVAQIERRARGDLDPIEKSNVEWREATGQSDAGRQHGGEQTRGKTDTEGELQLYKNSTGRRLREGGGAERCEKSASKRDSHSRPGPTAQTEGPSAPHFSRPPVLRGRDGTCAALLDASDTG